MLFSATLAKADGIITTLPPLASIVLMLSPETKVSCLLPNNADPHHFQLSPRQLERLQTTELLIRSSKDDGGWSIPSDKITTLDLWPQQDHAWLNPAMVKQILPHIADILQQHKPAQKTNIAEQLQQSLILLDKEQKAWQEALAELKTQGVILQHPSWQPLLKHYDIPIYTILESDQHGQEHGPHMLEHGLDILRQHPKAILLGDHSHSNRTLQWLANHSEHKSSVVLLNGMSQCGQNWFDFMRLNRERLQP
ncbi:MAG: zinc ABC transporter substrate-binding protein [Mariprofundaceae bacterium]